MGCGSSKATKKARQELAELQEHVRELMNPNVFFFDPDASEAVHVYGEGDLGDEIIDLDALQLEDKTGDHSPERKKASSVNANAAEVRYAVLRVQTFEEVNFEQGGRTGKLRPTSVTRTRDFSQSDIPPSFVAGTKGGSLANNNITSLDDPDEQDVKDHAAADSIGLRDIIFGGLTWTGARRQGELTVSTALSEALACGWTLVDSSTTRTYTPHRIGMGRRLVREETFTLYKKNSEAPTYKI
ncbi:unnamed protein product [Amoebophrya sp. A25]|nr:unnamed protein product [Amoebophrya sp. A25]|eukprot:GSA25T00020605001.1